MDGKIINALNCGIRCIDGTGGGYTKKEKLEAVGVLMEMLQKEIAKGQVANVT